MTETGIIAIFVFFGEFRKNDDVIRKSAILGKRMKIQIKLPQRSNHGKLHVKVCNSPPVMLLSAELRKYYVGIL